MPLDALTLLAPLLPSGVFDNGGLMAHIRKGFAAEGLSDDFRKLGPDLFVVACALDSGERVVFSRRSNANVPVSSAVAASSAIPLLFRPVRIDGVDYVDGGMKGISAIDIAVDAGATLIVVVNPIVPIDARRIESSPGSLGRLLNSHLTELGLRGVYNQVFRTVLHDGRLDHVRLVRNQYPDVDILLIEPRADDPKMFFHELLSFSAQLMVLQHGYEFGEQRPARQLGTAAPGPSPPRGAHHPAGSCAQAPAGAAGQHGIAARDAPPAPPDRLCSPSATSGPGRGGGRGLQGAGGPGYFWRPEEPLPAERRISPISKPRRPAAT